MKIRKWIAAALVFLCGTATVHAQDYPNRPITLVVPFAAAGPGRDSDGHGHAAAGWNRHGHAGHGRERPR